MWLRWLTLTALATLLPLGPGGIAFPQSPATTPSSPPSTAPASVVLTFPFENASQESSLEWLSEGLSELTIERLGGRGYDLVSRQERLNTLEAMGLPASTRFSHATMLKIAERADADQIIFGTYSSDGNTLTLTARVLRRNPPALSAEFMQSGLLADLTSLQSRLAGELFCALGRARTGPADCRGDNPAFALQVPEIPSAVLEAYAKGLTDTNDQERLRNLREAARLQPQWDAPAFALGDDYFVRRNCELALPWLNRISIVGERGFQAGFEAGVCDLLRGDPAKAEAAFVSLINRAGASPSAESQNNLGVALAREQKFPEALMAFQQAAAIDSKQADYWFNLGLLQIRAQRPEAAIDPLRRALALRPDDAQARTLTATALEQSGHADEAERERGDLGQAPARVIIPRNAEPADFARFDRIRMRLDPASLRPHAQSSSANLADGSAERGRQDLALHLTRGREFLDSGNFDDAQRAFVEALLLAPLDADAHRGLAEVYDLQGRPNDGVREYRAALTSRDDLSTHVALAGLLARQDRIAEARVEVQLVLNRDPNNARARALLDQINNRSTPVGPP